MAPQGTPEQSYCADEVRRHDWDRFLCTLFAPAERRPALFALLAFNIEIGRTGAMVSERVLGEIRLQWWRDAIAAIYAGDIATLKHPIVEGLQRTVASYGLERVAFDEMIDTRSHEMDEDPAADLPLLLAHAAGCEANLMRLQMRVLDAGPNVSEAARQIVDDLAVVSAIARLARSGRASTALISHGRERLRAARARRSRVDRRYLPVLLPAALEDAVLRGREPSRLRRQLSVAYRALRGKF